MTGSRTKTKIRTIVVRLNSSEFKSVQWIGVQDAQTYSEVIRALIREEIKRRGFTHISDVTTVDTNAN